VTQRARAASLGKPQSCRSAPKRRLKVDCPPADDGFLNEARFADTAPSVDDQQRRAMRIELRLERCELALSTDEHAGLT
jgi:hypothetical protein